METVAIIAVGSLVYVFVGFVVATFMARMLMSSEQRKSIADHSASPSEWVNYVSMILFWPVALLIGAVIGVAKLFGKMAAYSLRVLPDE